jgi:Protein of unknown function (DUF2997)
MATPTIVVTISPRGDVTVAVEGVAGLACQEMTRALEQTLGTTAEDRRTPEYFQRAAPGTNHVRLDSA